MLALGIVAAVVYCLLYNASIALQALEAREVPGEHSLRPSFDREVAAEQAMAWGYGAGIDRVAAGDRGVVVGAADGGAALLGEWADSVALAGGEEAGGDAGGGGSGGPAVAATWLGLAGVALAAPERTYRSRRGQGRLRWHWGLVAIPIAAPYVLRVRGPGAAATLAVVSAGCGYAWTAVASKLLTDELAAEVFLVAVAWLATAVASEGVALLSEMSALQRRPATHVAP